MTNLKERALDFRVQRVANKAGLMAIKSRSLDGYENQGGYMLIDPGRSLPVAGLHYDLTAKDVIKYLS